MPVKFTGKPTREGLEAILKGNNLIFTKDDFLFATNLKKLSKDTKVRAVEFGVSISQFNSSAYLKLKQRLNHTQIKRLLGEYGLREPDKTFDDGIDITVCTFYSYEPKLKMYIVYFCLEKPPQPKYKPQ